MDFGGAQVATPRGNSFAEAAGSPRRTPRHSRNSSVEALASAAAFVQPYKASILYGEPHAWSIRHKTMQSRRSCISLD